MRPRLLGTLVTVGLLAISGCAQNRSPYAPIGYGPHGGTGYPQTGYPPGYIPVNYPGGGPPIIWGPVITPGYPQTPQTPVVLKPVPVNPGQPTTPKPDPLTPVSNPVPVPQNPVDRTAKWAPWPLPPQRAAHALASSADNIPSDERRVDGTNPSPGEDLKFRGGKTLQNLGWVNLYVGGEQAGWTLAEVEKIEWSVDQAMNDQHLNNVMLQYFNNKPLGSKAHAAHPLVGYKPSVISRGDIQQYVEYLSDQGYLSTYDLKSTIFNFLLPPGTILNDEDLPENAASIKDYSGSDRLEHPVVEHDEAGDSTGGLGGYHGSIHYKNRTLYYSVEVYSERRSDGFTNGIPVFAEPWKNMCATLYHELCEFRTDPDVEDAIRDPYNPMSMGYLGWTSEAGEEIGDYPLHAGGTLRDIVKEVPLANGKGLVPVQFNYSNAVHGPEGPIDTPH